MIPLEGGFNQTVSYEPESHLVIKTFDHEDPSRPMRLRMLAEIWALQHVPVAPELKGVNERQIYMTFAEGTRSLDAETVEMPERLQFSVFHTAGETLAEVHNRARWDASDYHAAHMDRVNGNLEAAAEALIRKGIDPQRVYDYLNYSYQMDEVERHGLVWTHRDFWLNNLIGRPGKDSFELSNVIDWEMAGVGSPYEDFGMVEVAMERRFPDNAHYFWEGYGFNPDPDLKRHFAMARTLEWVAAEPADNDLSSDFYADKLAMIRETI